MHRFAKPAAVLGLAGALALAVATPSQARDGRNAAAVGAGIAGLAVGAMIGSAAANSHYQYGYGPYGYHGGYAYSPGYATYQAPAYRSYGYAPGYAYDNYNDAYASGVTQYDRRDPSSYYAPGGSYGPHSYTGYQNRERALTGGDW